MALAAGGRCRLGIILFIKVLMTVDAIFMERIGMILQLLCLGQFLPFFLGSLTRFGMAGNAVFHGITHF